MIFPSNLWVSSNSVELNGITLQRHSAVWGRNLRCNVDGRAEETECEGVA